jgi:hypothetical protein
MSSRLGSMDGMSKQSSKMDLISAGETPPMPSGDMIGPNNALHLQLSSAKKSLSGYLTNSQIALLENQQFLNKRRSTISTQKAFYDAGMGSIPELVQANTKMLKEEDKAKVKDFWARILTYHFNQALESSKGLQEALIKKEVLGIQDNKQQETGRDSLMSAQTIGSKISQYKPTITSNRRRNQGYHGDSLVNGKPQISENVLLYDIKGRNVVHKSKYLVYKLHQTITTFGKYFEFLERVSATNGPETAMSLNLLDLQNGGVLVKLKNLLDQFSKNIEKLVELSDPMTKNIGKRHIVNFPYFQKALEILALKFTNIGMLIKSNEKYSHNIKDHYSSLVSKICFNLNSSLQKFKKISWKRKINNKWLSFSNLILQLCDAKIRNQPVKKLSPKNIHKLKARGYSSEKGILSSSNKLNMKKKIGKI